MDKREEIVKIVIGFASDQVRANTENVTEETRFTKGLGFDSLDFLETAMSIEDQYDINVSDEDIETIDTIKDAVDLIERKLRERR